MQQLNVCITGAAGQIAYSLFNMIGEGSLFGHQQKISLKLLDTSARLQYLRAVIMQIEDSGHSLISRVQATDSLQVAFNEADFVIFLGGLSRKPGQDRDQFFQQNYQIFKAQGLALQSYAKETCKSLVVTNPPNLMCHILKHYCPKIPIQNFSGLMKLDVNRARGHIARSLNCKIQEVKGMIVWGNHSSTLFPDCSYVTVKGKPLLQITNIDEFVTQIQTQVKTRGGQILKKKGVTSVLSAAKAIKDHISVWRNGSSGELVSMGVLLDKDLYGIKRGICISLPVICKGNYQIEIKQDLRLSETQLKKLSDSEQDLLYEQSLVYEDN